MSNFLKHPTQLQVAGILQRVLNDFNSQSYYSSLTEHKYLKKHFIKLSLETVCCFFY